MKARTRKNANNGASFRSTHKHGRKSDTMAVVSEFMAAQVKEVVVSAKFNADGTFTSTNNITMDREDAMDMATRMSTMSEESFIDIFGNNEFIAVTEAVTAFNI